MEPVEMRPVWSMSDSEKLDTLDAAQATIAALQTYTLQLAAGLEQSGYAKEIGARDTARLLAFRYRMDTGQAKRIVALATTLHKYPAVAAALPDPLNADREPEDDREPDDDRGPDDDGAQGEEDAGARPQPSFLLHPAQAEAIVGALEQVPDTVPVDDLAVAEEQMVQAARHLSPADLRRLGKKVRDTLDADGLEPAEDKAARREKLTLKNADHGVEFNGFLANENAELFRALVHAGAKPHKTPDGDRDPRPRDKRQSDALVTLLELAAGSDGVPGRPRVVVTIDFDTLRNATRNATDHATRTGTGTGTGTGDATDDAASGGAGGMGDLVFGDSLSAGAVRRMACDAEILPIVLGSDSRPLDVGRDHRLVTDAIRAALVKRDRGCVICHAPPPNCHAHHLVAWFEGGPTSLDNLVLVCRTDHTDVHGGHHVIQIINGAVHVTHPTWATPSHHQRLNLRGSPPTTPTEQPGGHSGSPPDPPRPPALWPRTADPGWITPAETADLNPWGDQPPSTPGNPGTPKTSPTGQPQPQPDRPQPDPWCDQPTPDPGNPDSKSHSSTRDRPPIHR